MARNATDAPSYHLGTATPRIGEMLVERGLVSEHEVSAALQLQRQTGHRLGETLVNLGVVSPRAGFAFATALRSILSADPDVILVGEIRDTETAKIAMEAALTGHLVLSTIHSVRAAEVPLRLVDMGVEPYVVSSSLSCAVAQRLVRLLCPSCSLPNRPDPAVQEALGIPHELVEAGTVRAPGGCAQCGHTGYRGRTAIYEVLTFSEQMSRLLASGASASELQGWAIADGMHTMQGNALARVLQGDVSVDEYLRVFG